MVHRQGNIEYIVIEYLYPSDPLHMKAHTQVYPLKIILKPDIKISYFLSRLY